MRAWLILETCGSLGVEPRTRPKKEKKKGNSCKQINPFRLFPAACDFSVPLCFFYSTGLV